jgi:hypothetical protein
MSNSENSAMNAVQVAGPESSRKTLATKARVLELVE